MRSEYIRSTHPAGPPVPKLRLLGTSWYRRGVGYWLRRACLALSLTLLTVFMVFLLASFVMGLASTAHGWAKVLIIAVAVSAALWSTCSAFLSTRSREAHVVPPPAGSSSARKPAVAGLGLGVAARGGSPIAGALVFVGALFAIGWLIVPAALSFRRYLGPEEKAAVLAVQEWKAQHPGWRP